MIGPKKLSTISQELDKALAATGEDPIRWLEARMSECERRGTATSGESEVLQSLRRILEGTRSAKRRGRRTGANR
jgi:hypothetical protein